MSCRRPLGIPAIIAAGIRRAEKERRAAVIARPMRNLMDMLRQGEVYEIAPAIRGWIDCWGRLAPDLRLYHMAVLADRLDADKPLTPRLVEQARDEFDATVARIAEIPPGQITSAIRTTEIAWEMEKLQKREAA